MSSYVDKWGRYHHKKVVNGDPIPSNNGFIYTAYAEKAKLPIDYLMLEMCFMKCKVANIELDNGISLLRSPGQSTPPISRDEILGMAALGFLKSRHLNGWNFSPFPIPPFNIFKTIAQFLELKGKHRNYIWLNNMSHTYRFAFSVPLTDRHFILKCWGKFNPIYWLIAKIDSKFSKPKNGIHWLKYGGEDRKIIMQQEFPEDHPLRNV